MPNCYALKHKDTATPNLSGNAQFIAIDEAMCAAFGVKPDPVTWYADWENRVGISLATGKSLESVRLWLLECGYSSTDPLIAAVCYLRNNYTVDCWYQHKH